MTCHELGDDNVTWGAQINGLAVNPQLRAHRSSKQAPHSQPTPRCRQRQDLKRGGGAEQQLPNPYSHPPQQPQTPGGNGQQG